jgi:outer membrane lipoprotein SlyB
MGGRDGNLIVTFETLRLANGTKRQIEAVLVKPPKIESSSNLKAVMIIGATMLGGIAGAVSGKESGVLIGAGIGAGAGTGFCASSKR